MAVVIGTNAGFVAGPTAPSADPDASTWTITEYAQATQDTSPGTGYAVTEMGLWIHLAMGAVGGALGIYSNDASTNPDRPNVLLASENISIGADDDGVWKTADVSWSCLDGLHWVAYQADSGTNTYTDASAIGGSLSVEKSGQSSLPDPYGAPTNDYAYGLAVYALYSAVGGASVLLFVGDTMGGNANSMMG